MPCGRRSPSAPMVMPSNTRSANSERITRSLKVPGSPSSALQTTYFVRPATSAASSHFRLVGKPAPPRPRRPERPISAKHVGRRLAPGPRPARCPARSCEKVSVAGSSCGWSWRGAPSVVPMAWTPNVCRHSSRMPWTFSGVTRVKICSLTSSAGPWSHIPRQLAQRSENLPSGVVSPKSDAQVVLQLPGDVLLAGHVAGDRAAEADHELPLRLLVEEAVERDDAVDLDRMDVQQVGDHLHAVFGDAEVPPLHFLKDRHQRAALAAERSARATSSSRSRSRSVTSIRRVLPLVSNHLECSAFLTISIRIDGNFIVMNSNDTTFWHIQ